MYSNLTAENTNLANLFAEITIGFDSSIYAVNECGDTGQVSVRVTVLEGMLERELTLMLTTTDMTAIGESLIKD